jgi:membrane-associated phospholipid phosphatase
MKRSLVLNLAGGFVLMHIFFLVQPAFCQDSKESDPNPSAIEAEAGQGDLEAAPNEVPMESDPKKAENLELFPPSNDKESKRSMMGQFVADIWTDQKAIWTSPFRMNRRQALTIALPLAAATAGLIATDSRTSKWLPNTPDQVNWSQRFSEFGAVYTLALVTGGPLVGGKIIDRPDYTQIGRNALEALANSMITNYALKGITGRERPNAVSGAGKFWHGGQSFPSGHTMNSWAVALAIARTPKCPRWFAITSYIMATAISFSRYSANKHFASDILVGGVVGGLIGNYVAKRHR